MIPLRLVVDTNILVSAALKPDGLQRTVLVLATTKPAHLYVTGAILAEYREVLASDSQGPATATTPAHQEPFALHQARARAPR